MKHIEGFFGILIIFLWLIHDYATAENEITLKRFRRIIRGHLATPGQVTKRYFQSIIEFMIEHYLYLVSISSLYQ